MVDGIPPEILQAAKQVAAHKEQEKMRKLRVVKGGRFYLEMNVRDDQKLVEIWLTNAEKIDPVLREGLKEIYAKYKTKKYMVAVFESGKGDLYKNTPGIFSLNRRRSAEKTVQQAKNRRPRVWSGKQRGGGGEKSLPPVFFFTLAKNQNIMYNII